MPTTFEHWSPVAIVAAVAITAGIVLLVLYAVRRGLVHRELEGIESDVPDAPGPTVPARVGREGRNLGVAGSALLVVGLALGLLVAITGWGSGPAGTGGPGTGPGDCAGGWNGCPQATPAASAKP